MNKQWVLFHLNEALDELSRTVHELKTHPEGDDIEFELALIHVYHHLNTAWNARAVTDEQTAKATDEDFYRWRAFPSDIPLPS